MRYTRELTWQIPLLVGLDGFLVQKRKRLNRFKGPVPLNNRAKELVCRNLIDGISQYSPQLSFLVFS
jgi:hypothetical protein